MVETQHGSIEGLVESTYFGIDVDVFRGIPFAVAPVGERRFTNPEFYGDFPSGNNRLQGWIKSCNFQKKF